MLGGGLLVISLIAIYVVVIWVVVNETEDGDGRIGLLALRMTPRERKGRKTDTKDGSPHPVENTADGKPNRRATGKPKKKPGFLK